MRGRKRSRLTLGKKHQRKRQKLNLNCDWDVNFKIIENENCNDDNKQTGIMAESSEASGHEEQIDNGTESSNNLFESALEKMKKVKQDFFLTQFLTLVVNGLFPFDNICFHLFCELVQWLSVPSTSAMRYSNTSKEFWWTGKMLFGGKFLRFMEGFKHKGSLTSNQTQKGFYDPNQTRINFAVPSENIITGYSPFDQILNYSSTVKPGIIKPMLDLSSSIKGNTSNILTFDGKKIIPNSTDIDLLGCEDDCTMKMKESIQEDEDYKNKIMDLVEKLENYLFPNLNDMSSDERKCIAEQIKTIHRHISKRHVVVRDISQKKQYALLKLKEKNLQKDVYLMNHLQTFIYKCDNTTKEVIANINNLCHIVAILNDAGHIYAIDTNADFNLQDNYAELKAPEIIKKFAGVDDNAIPTYLTKQKTDDWYDIRKTVKVTGSTAFHAIGLDTLKEQKQYFDQVFSQKGRDFSPSQMEAMEHGRQHEIDAVTTLVCKIMPVLYPNLVYHEEGVYMLKDTETNRDILAVSPDGSLRENRNDTIVEHENTAVASIEIKCPFNISQGPYHSVPKRYICQCLLEQKVLNSSEHLLVCWTPETTTVVRVPYNDELVDDIVELVNSVYYSNVPRRPTKISDKSKTFSKKSDDLIKDGAYFIGEFQSITSVTPLSIPDIQETETTSPYFRGSSQKRESEQSINFEEICHVLLTSIQIIETMKKLYTKKASEAIVFSLADTDRIWHRETGHGMPIGYFFRGYSMSTKCMRDIARNMLEACVSNCIHVPCSTFDGQWFKLKDEAHDGSPLSLFQLMRQHWNNSCKLSKDELLSYLCEVRNNVIVNNYPTSCIVYNASGEIHISYGKDLFSGDTALTYPTVLPKQKCKSKKQVVNEEVYEVLSEILESPDSSVLDIDDENLYETMELEMTDDVTEAGSEVSPTNAMSEGYFLNDVDKSAIQIILLNSKRKRQRFTAETLSKETIVDLFKSFDSINRLTDAEVKDIILYLNINLKKTDQEMSTKGSKVAKIQELCKLFNLEFKKEHKSHSKKVLRNPQTLQQMSKTVLKKYGKGFLETLYANHSGGSVEKEWRASIPVETTVNVKGTGYTIKPLYAPEKVLLNGKQFLHITCLDGHHIRTNIRAKICKTGTDDLKKKAWIDVAKSKETPLSLAMIEVNKDGKILDQQSDKFVRTMFCETVEEKLFEFGYENEARFTKLFRGWHDAEDLPGIEAVERCRKALALREWLLDGISLDEFPPPGSHIKGIPRITFEGLICNIEAHVYMYALCKTGTYNWRSMTTLVAESFFSEISEMESHNNGVPSGDSFQRNMSVIAGLHAIRLKPDRIFCMQTAKSRNYLVPVTHTCTSDVNEECSKELDTGIDVLKIGEIYPRDHEFDKRIKKIQTCFGYSEGTI